MRLDKKQGLATTGALLLLAGIAWGQATRPATTTTTPAPTPRTTAQAFFAALDRGDVAAAHALTAPAEKFDGLIDATVALAATLKKLDTAAVDRFGEPGRKVARNLLHLADILQALPHANEKIEGDSATLTNGGGEPIAWLKRVEGQWRIIMPPPPQSVDRTRKLYAMIGQAAQETTASISSGAHPTADDAAAAFARKLFQARIAAQ